MDRNGRFRRTRLHGQFAHTGRCQRREHPGPGVQGSGLPAGVGPARRRDWRAIQPARRHCLDPLGCRHRGQPLCGHLPRCDPAGGIRIPGRRRCAQQCVRKHRYERGERRAARHGRRGRVPARARRRRPRLPPVAVARLGLDRSGQHHGQQQRCGHTRLQRRGRPRLRQRHIGHAGERRWPVARVKELGRLRQRDRVVQRRAQHGLHVGHRRQRRGLVLYAAGRAVRVWGGRL